jgi:serine/threonine protein kinase
MEPLSADDPRQIGEFSLRSRLGAGGMGRVYLAFSPGGRAVAMKVVHPGLAADPEFLRRFRNEVAAARAVSGMYTAPVVGAGIDDNPPWLATAYVPGPPLAEVVTRYGPLPETAVWRLAAGLTEALRAVHACGLVHRDLKPGNVLLAADGPHVIDFGISRAFEGTAVTSTGMVVGTPGYMSPEQAEGQQAGPPSDVFSLGCVLAYAVTGNAPFGGGSAASILYRVVTAEPDLSGVPASLRQVITACLAKNPAERIGLAQLGPMIAALGPAMSGKLGAFWPEPLAGIIAADNTHPVTQVSGSPFGPPPISQDPVSHAPVNQAAGSPAPVSQVLSGSPFSPAPGGSPVSPAQSGWNSAVAGGQAGGAPAQPGLAQQPGIAQQRGIAQPNSLPPGGTPGVTGHAPMVADGYYAAATFGMGAPNPAANSPAAPGSAPVQPPYAEPQYGQSQYGQPQYGQPQYGQPQYGQPQYGQPQYGQPSVEQAWAPQYPVGQQPATWQQPNPSIPPTTPATQYPSQYPAPSWPQQAAQAPAPPAPSTPWPQQQPASGGSWPGSGQPSGPGGPSGPSGPGFPSAATPLAQYAPARRRPAKAEIPPPVLGAIRLMYVGAVVTLVDVIIGSAVAASYSAYWSKYQYTFPDAARHHQTMANILDTTTALGGVIGIVCWLVIAAACRRGRAWTRVAGTVLLVLDTASLLTVMLATHNDPGVKAASLVVWIIGLSAVIPLWGRQASNFFLAFRKR